ncbi:Mu transposase C-terminal domain-containing protein [Paracoccus jeotgali]|uniref:Integrase n=1 Tax=Paracoccus jeotgali TaxID=2065379 RepID=A0A2K9MC45_9RHOB|nr:DDE-type integrase/transposase/recombinase [Paracoccus jeotgali]AUM73082.1 integrase [Paracoccus jeotgali]
MTIRFRFAKSDLITAAGIAMRPLEIDDKGGLFERLGQPGITERLSHEELADLLRQPDTTYVAGYFDRAVQDLRGRKPADIINALADPIRRLVIWRKAVCNAFLALESSEEINRTHAGYLKGRAKLAAEVERRVGEGMAAAKLARPGVDIVTRQLPGSRTALHWVRNYEAAGYSAIALIPETHRCGNRTPRWCHQSEALMNQVIEIYADTQRPSKAAAVADTRTLFVRENTRRLAAGAGTLIVPSAASINRRLNLADPYYVHAKRYGTAAANAKFTFYENGVDVQQPLERVEMDENRLDVISLLTLTGIWDHLPSERQERFETGRRWLYVAIDCATRCILSMRLAETPNSGDAVRALRDIFIDKTPMARAAGCESTWHHHGGVQALVTDQGTAFTSDDFQGAILSLGVTPLLPPAGKPWLRGHIESFFRTYGHLLMPLLAGRTFFDTIERGDYPSEQLACLCDDDLITILLTYVVDIYHNQKHGSLGGETPNEAWARLVAKHGTPPVPDGLTLRRAFGRPLQRKLRGDGVFFSGLTYSCEALREAFLHSPQRSVEVRADLRDMGWIAVKVGAIWHPATANQGGFDGISFDLMQEAVRTLRIKHRKDAELAAPKVRRAIEQISEINRRAFALRELTPFHVTDLDVERHQAALHYPVRSDAERLGHATPSADPLAEGIQITPRALMPPDSPRDNPEPPLQERMRKNRWRFDDEQ